MKERERAARPGSQEHEFEAQLLTNGSTEQPTAKCRLKRRLQRKAARNVECESREQITLFFALGIPASRLPRESYGRYVMPAAIPVVL
jgi:hypothetical protein